MLVMEYAKDQGLEREVSEIDCKAIMQSIPHRYPFLMIDRIAEMSLGDRAVGLKNVTINEAHFQGHFPGEPIMPGVLIIEALAQTAAVLVVRTLGKDAEGKLVYFMSIDNARFRRPVVPGDQLRLEVQKDRHRGPVWRFIGKATVDGQLVAEATFAAMMREGEVP